MAAPPKVGSVFDPTDIAALSRAYEVALRTANEEGGKFATIPGYKLRHQLATLILAEARHGPKQAERLAEGALRSMRLLSVFDLPAAN